MPFALFALVIFDRGPLFLPMLEWMMLLLFILPTVAGMIGAYHHYFLS
jgi:hypothetical protein